MNQATSQPHYPFLWKNIGLTLRDALLFRSRSFRADAIQAIQTLSPQPKTINQINIPAKGPCLLVMNHYSRPRFDTWWIALGISAAVPVEIHWMMTAAWTHLGPLEPITRWLFPRMARIYGFTPTPPMPPAPGDIETRTQAVRRVLRVARTPGAVIGLAPEGCDHPGGILGQPPPGVGRFVLQLVKHCQRIIPIGVYEEAGYLSFNFGPAFELEIPSNQTPNERDHFTSDRVMRAIARQLPLQLRGVYDEPGGTNL